MATCMRLILILLLYMLVDHEDYPHLAALCFMLLACLNEVLPHACTNGNITYTFWHMFSRNSQPASVLSIAMDQFTCTVLLDVATCFRAWGYWMHEKEMHWKKKEGHTRSVIKRGNMRKHQSHDLHMIAWLKPI